MSQRVAKLFQVLVRQMLRDRDANVMFEQALGAFGNAELFEPLRNLLHHANIALPILDWQTKRLAHTRAFCNI